MISDFGQAAAVFGASGGIGKALAVRFAETVPRVYAFSRTRQEFSAKNIVSLPFDLGDETSLAEAADAMRGHAPQTVIVASGVLTLSDGSGPERTLRRLDAGAMAEVLQINLIGPAMIAKHILPLLPRDKRSVFAALSARVGSITDNGLGGWHSYRASKAGLNMLLKNFAIEMARTHPKAVIAGLHPGTVDTELSRPFQSGLAEGQLTKASASADNLLRVISGLSANDSGKVFDWKGDEIAP